jgi:rod shape-determining protein MreD
VSLTSVRSSSALHTSQPTRLVLVGGLVFLAQWLVFSRLSIFGAIPDAPLLFIAWVSLRYGRLPGTLAGFGLGVLMDAVLGTWGLHMLAKTIVGFIAGMFQASERELLIISPGQALVGGFVVALVHNGLFVLLLALSESMRQMSLIWGTWLGGSLYTAVLAFVVCLFVYRR